MSAWTVVFPTELFDAGRVDDAFAAELQAARTAGHSVALIDQERLDRGEVDAAVRRVQAEGDGIYRGWMLDVGRYAALHDALRARGLRLINTPEQYRHAHHLPASFERIADRSPAAVWVPGEPGVVEMDAVVDAARSLGPGPALVKDYVKSRKHEWLEACFIPSAHDEAAVRRVVGTFVERQAEALIGGVVLRELVALESVGTHPRSGMPMGREHRVFVLDGAPLITGRTWADGDYPDEPPPLDAFASTMRAIDSRFFTLDLARTTDGRWVIIELGDAQVAGLLDTIATADLYAALAD